MSVLLVDSTHNDIDGFTYVDVGLFNIHPGIRDWIPKPCGLRSDCFMEELHITSDGNTLMFKDQEYIHVNMHTIVSRYYEH